MGEGISYNTPLRHSAGLNVTTARVSHFGNVRDFRFGAGWQQLRLVSDYFLYKQQLWVRNGSYYCLATATRWKSARLPTVSYSLSSSCSIQRQPADPLGEDLARCNPLGKAVLKTWGKLARDKDTSQPTMVTGSGGP